MARAICYLSATMALIAYSLLHRSARKHLTYKKLFKLQELKNCKTLPNLAALLGYSSSGLSYIIYKIDDSKKYSSFQINKKSGGKRTIFNPCPELKSLQRKLANLLYDCIEEQKPSGEKITDFKGSDEKIPNRRRAVKAISHGYEKGLSIATNAERHIKKRYVYNIDLESFFPSFNFGRVRGFFIKNKQFKLHPKIATLIAQIACHKNELPQGSPCSPVISNLISKNLDYYLLKIAQENGCVYTRYVDDLTFSTNKKLFPKAVASSRRGIFSKQSWSLGKITEEAILKAGFKVNIKKCRMQISDSRQEVTGLVVNSKINISSHYYKSVRAMCHSLFQHGYYTLPQMKEPLKKKSWFSKLKNLIFFNPTAEDSKDIREPEKQTSMEVLQGKLAHIYNIKSYRNKFVRKGYRPTKHDGIRTKNRATFPSLDRSETYEDDNHVVALDGIKNLYGKFLFFKHFYANDKPTIICEGKTDNTYLKCALERLAGKYPKLSKNEEYQFQVHFFHRTTTNCEMLKLAEGAPGLVYLIEIYKRFCNYFKIKGKTNPVIIVVDNDKAGKGVIKKAEKIRDENRRAKNITTKRRDDYFFENLYIIEVPSDDGDKEIEDLFDSEILNTKLKGKTFYRKNTGLNEDIHYGKAHFAEYVIKANKQTIDFGGFEPLLDLLDQIIGSHDSDSLD